MTSVTGIPNGSASAVEAESRQKLPEPPSGNGVAMTSQPASKDREPPEIAIVPREDVIGATGESASGVVENNAQLARVEAAVATDERPGTGGSETVEGRLNIMEDYGKLMDKAYQKFSRLRDLPPYGRNKWDPYYHKAFHVYARLWKFQQEHRQQLVELGLKRWEVGEIASRIGQLYYNYYLRTSEASFLFEAYIFYDAIATREYFKENARADAALANKQLRYLARFIVVCLLLNRRETVRKLLRQLRMLVEDYTLCFQTADAKEWRLIVQEIIRFMKADAVFEGTRSIRYNVLLDPPAGALPHVTALLLKDGPTPLKLQEAILTSYHQNEVKFSELTLDTFRVLQAIEWEPSGSFLRSKSGEVVNAAVGSAGGINPSKVGGMDENLVDPSLPPNPHKYILYRPSVPQLLLVLATAVEELPADSILLLYISASGVYPQSPSPIASPVGDLEPPPRSTPPPAPQAFSAPGSTSSTAANPRADSDSPAVSTSKGPPSPKVGSLDSEASELSTPATSPGSAAARTPPPSLGEMAPSRGSGNGRTRLVLQPSREAEGGDQGEGGDGAGRVGDGRSSGGGVWLGARRDFKEGVGRRAAAAVQAAAKAAGDSFLYPEDLLPFTRRPLLIIVDSDSSPAFEFISGEERGEAAVLLLSPLAQPSDDKSSSSRPTAAMGGNLFTFFLTAPLLAFCRLTNVSIVNMRPALYETTEKQLAMELSGWGAALAANPDIDCTWGRLLGDPFLRQFILRFVFCRAAFALHVSYRDRPEYLPRCCPPLPAQMLPASNIVANGIRQLAISLGIGDQFGVPGGKSTKSKHGDDGLPGKHGTSSPHSKRDEGWKDQPGVIRVVRSVPKVPPGFEKLGKPRRMPRDRHTGREGAAGKRGRDEHRGAGRAGAPEGAGHVAHPVEEAASGVTPSMQAGGVRVGGSEGDGRERFEDFLEASFRGGVSGATQGEGEGEAEAEEAEAALQAGGSPREGQSNAASERTVLRQLALGGERLRGGGTGDSSLVPKGESSQTNQGKGFRDYLPSLRGSAHEREGQWRGAEGEGSAEGEAGIAEGQEAHPGGGPRRTKSKGKGVFSKLFHLSASGRKGSLEREELELLGEVGRGEEHDSGYDGGNIVDGTSLSGREAGQSGTAGSHGRRGRWRAGKGSRRGSGQNRKKDERGRSARERETDAPPDKEALQGDEMDGKEDPEAEGRDDEAVEDGTLKVFSRSMSRLDPEPRVHLEHRHSGIVEEWEKPEVGGEGTEDKSTTKGR